MWPRRERLPLPSGLFLIRLPDRVGGDIRMVARTNFLAENFFGELEHDERRRSGHKNLGHDLELMPAEAALVRNLERDDDVTIVCGSLDRLAEAFAEMDRDEQERLGEAVDFVGDVDVDVDPEIIVAAPWQDLGGLENVGRVSLFTIRL